MMLLMVWILGIDLVCHTVGDERVCVDAGQAQANRQTENERGGEPVSIPTLDPFASNRDIRDFCSKAVEPPSESKEKRELAMVKEVLGNGEESEIEVFCSAMREAMGAEHERVVDRGVELQQIFCAKFQHVPAEPPQDPDLRKQWSEFRKLVSQYRAWLFSSKRIGNDLPRKEYVRAMRMEIDFRRMSSSCERERGYVDDSSGTLIRVGR
jgi:hypothetical protein